MNYWGVKSYENDDAGDALDAGFDPVHGALVKNSWMTTIRFHSSKFKRDLQASRLWKRRSRLCGNRLLWIDPPEEWDESARLALAGIVRASRRARCLQSQLSGSLVRSIGSRKRISSGKK